MKTKRTSWNLGYLLPKRDLGTLDLEDLKGNDLRNTFVKPPRYQLPVSKEMIVDATYDADNLIVEEELVYDDGEIRIYFIDHAEDLEMEVREPKIACYNPVVLADHCADNGSFFEQIFRLNREDDLLERLVNIASIRIRAIASNIKSQNTLRG